MTPCQEPAENIFSDYQHLEHSTIYWCKFQVQSSLIISNEYPELGEGTCKQDISFKATGSQNFTTKLRKCEDLRRSKALGIEKSELNRKT